MHCRPFSVALFDIVNVQIGSGIASIGGTPLGCRVCLVRYRCLSCPLGTMQRCQSVLREQLRRTFAKLA